MKNYKGVLTKLGKFKILVILLLPSIIWAQSFTGKMNSFQGYDHDQDGINEINTLKYVSFDINSKSPSYEKDLVLVLVEKRLFKKIPDSEYSETDLINQLEKYKTDLKKDGLESRFIISDVYKGGEHQDGLTVLALRKWFQTIHENWNLKAVVLVGSFPEAMLVRRWIWRKENSNIEINGKMQTNVDYLRIVPEIISDRSDLVLADLDGNWDKIYEKEKKGLEYFEALPAVNIDDSWPNDQDIFNSSSFNKGHLYFEDFFWIKDDNYLVIPPPSSYLSLKLSTALRNPEISQADKNNPNPIAIPEILVSRINPFHIAVKYDYPLDTGINFLDEDGKPRVYETSVILSKANYIKRSAAMERKLLMEYFGRNHKFRNGDYTNTYSNTAAISYGNGIDHAPELLKYLKEGIQNPQNSLLRKSASLLDYISFLQYNANLKGATAHSSSLSSEYGKVDDLKYLYKRLGGHIYRWKRTFDGSNYTFTPSIEGHNGSADAHFHRSVYENGLLAKTNPCFYIHMGCRVNSPHKFKEMGYSHPIYSTIIGEQNAESILFFTKGLAIASRAKVFNDWPNGFTKELGTSTSKRFGEGLIAYHNKESQNSNLLEDQAQSKRPYTWSIQGDATLRLRYEKVKGE